MTEYYTLYDNAVDAITAVLPGAFVGGPGTTYSGPIGLSFNTRRAPTSA